MLFMQKKPVEFLMKTSEKPSKVKMTVQVDAEFKPLLDLMLKKANLSLSDLNETFIPLWIGQNKDLLTPSELEQFKNRFLHQ
jgi:hypothetical protein